MPGTKEMLDDMHRAKIDMADEIYVINVGGYIGSSTRGEIEYALKTGKKVSYLESIDKDASTWKRPISLDGIYDGEPMYEIPPRRSNPATETLLGLRAITEEDIVD